MTQDEWLRETCGTRATANEVLVGHFLAELVEEWFAYHKVYCSPACRDFRAHVIAPPKTRATAGKRYCR